MSYCLGINTADGLVLASDSRSSSGSDRFSTCQKMHQFVIPGERVFVILTTGSLSLSQSVITLLRQDFDAGAGLAKVPTMYDAARELGSMVRRISDIDRTALEKDNFSFNVHLLLGGQIKGQPHELYLIYPQGNPLRSTPDSPFLQIGESKYGRPILDRGIIHQSTTTFQAAKYSLLSLEATMRSNATVGPPVDLLLYNRDDLRVSHYRRFYSHDPDLIEIHNSWEKALRHAVHQLPDIRFDGGDVRSTTETEPPTWQSPVEQS
ncbi:peptidase [Prosthecobacter sp.]|uniref:peptidase n=1 Tax=Prosthecobacter sp. TaxID=1965333 RepID=UPI0037830826